LNSEVKDQLKQKLCLLS